MRYETSFGTTQLDFIGLGDKGNTVVSYQQSAVSKLRDTGIEKGEAWGPRPT